MSRSSKEATLQTRPILHGTEVQFAQRAPRKFTAATEWPSKGVGTPAAMARSVVMIWGIFVATGWWMGPAEWADDLRRVRHRE